MKQRLFIRVKRNAIDTGLEYCLYCADEKTEQASYSDFDEFIDVEVLQNKSL